MLRNQITYMGTLRGNKKHKKKQNEKDDRKKKKNKEKIASIDFNSTNFYIEVEMFTMNAI